MQKIVIKKRERGTKRERERRGGKDNIQKEREEAKEKDRLLA